jgi:hypothetical protein
MAAQTPQMPQTPKDMPQWLKDALDKLKFPHKP